MREIFQAVCSLLLLLLLPLAAMAQAQVSVDDVKSLRDALAAADGPTVITLAPGRYDFWPEDSAHEWIYVSCTSSEVEWADKTKVIGLWIYGHTDVTIKADGATMVCHGDMTPIGISDSRNITIEGLEVDFERPGMSEFTYVSCESGSTVVRFHKDSWYAIEDGTLQLVGEGWKTETPHCNIYSPADGRVCHARDWDVLSRCRAVEIEPGLVRFDTPADFTAVPGEVVNVRDRIRRQTGSLIQYSENIRLQGMKYRFMHGIGVMSQFTDNVSIVDCVFAPSEQSGRVMASSADFVHFSDCKGLVEVRGCTFKGAQDDPINVHGTNLQVVRRTGPRSAVVRFMHHQTYGIREYCPGDTVAFGHADMLNRYRKAVVRGVRRLDDREIELTFDRRLPGRLIIGSDFVENLTWSPEVIISGNHFSRTSTRGVLLTTPRKAIIENNVFEKVRMSGILIGADARSWFSSGPVCDVTIRGNRFEDTSFLEGDGFAQISIHPENSVTGRRHPVDRNILIEGNTFILGPANQALFAKSVRGLTFRGNTIIRESGDAPEAILQCCTEVSIDIGEGLLENIPYFWE